MEDSPGILTLDGTSVEVDQQPTYHPCDGVFGFAVSPLVDLDELRSLSTQISGVYGDDYIFLVEVDGEVNDASGTRTAAISEGTQVSKIKLDFSSSSLVFGPITAEWRGGAWSDGVLRMAKAGTHEFDARVSLYVAHVEEDEIATVDLVDRTDIYGELDIPQPSTACELWPSLAESITNASGFVEIAGIDTGLRPSITWRDGYASRIFGDLGPVGSSALDSVQSFISDNEGIFGVVGTDPVNALSLAESVPRSNGRFAHVFHQYVMMDSTPIKVLWSRFVASELNGTIYRVGGRFYRDIPAEVATPNVSTTSAIVTAKAYASSMGWGANRAAGVDEWVAAFDGSDYVPATIIRLESDPSVSSPREVLVVVSMTSSSVLETSWEGAAALKSATVTKWDSNMQLSYSGSLVQGPYGDEDTVYVDLEPADPLVLQDVGQKIEFVKIKDPDGVIPEYPASQVDLTASLPANVSNPNAEGKTKAAILSFYQVRGAISYFEYLRPQGFPSVRIEVERSGIAAGQYNGSNTIALKQDWYGDSDLGQNISFAPSHELFHHVDENTIDLCHGESHIVPNAIKEGLAEFAAQSASLAGVRRTNHGAPEVADLGTAILCLLGVFADGARRECVQRERTYKYPGVMIWSRPIVPSTHASVIPQPPWPSWPDCRRHSYPSCMVVAPPSHPRNQLDWVDPGDSSHYGIVATTLFDVVESTTNVIAAFKGTAVGDAYAGLAPKLVFEAVMNLDSQASFRDLKREVIIELAVASDAAYAGSAQLIATSASGAFTRHGFDHILEQYCTFGSGDCR